MHNSKKVAFSGILVALNFLLLFLGSVFQVFDYSSAALCGLLMIYAVLEHGTKTAASIFFASGLLALLLLPHKLPAVLFLLFSGWYPFLKKAVERLPSLLSWTVKISAFNVMTALIILISKKLFHIEDEVLAFQIVFFAIANFTFVLYDMVLTRLITFYVVKIKKHLK